MIIGTKVKLHSRKREVKHKINRKKWNIKDRIILLANRVAGPREASFHIFFFVYISVSIYQLSSAVSNSKEIKSEAATGPHLEKNRSQAATGPHFQKNRSQVVIKFNDLGLE